MCHTCTEYVVVTEMTVIIVSKGCVIWSCITLPPPGSVLLRQTGGDGRTALDLVSAASQREELLHSAQVGDSALRTKGTEVLNLPLLEAGSSLLAHIIFSYQQERGMPCRAQPSDKSHSLGYRLVRAVEAHSLQKVTLGWTDQRAVRLVEDAETRLELGRGSYLGQVSQAVKECKGENTLFLMEILEDLKSRGEALAADLWWRISGQRTEKRLKCTTCDWNVTCVSYIQLFIKWLYNSPRPLNDNKHLLAFCECVPLLLFSHSGKRVSMCFWS